MATAVLLPVIAAVTAGIQLVYSSARYAAEIVLKPPTNDQPAPLTPAQKRNLPRVAKRILPQGSMYEKFARDHRNTYYQEPNPAARNVNPEATLPPGYYAAYQQRLSRAFLVKCIGSNQRQWMMDPNLKVAYCIPPRESNQAANIEASQWHYESPKGQLPHLWEKVPPHLAIGSR